MGSEGAVRGAVPLPRAGPSLNGARRTEQGCGCVRNRPLPETDGIGEVLRRDEQRSGLGPDIMQDGTGMARHDPDLGKRPEVETDGMRGAGGYGDLPTGETPGDHAVDMPGGDLHRAVMVAQQRREARVRGEPDGIHRLLRDAYAGRRPTTLEAFDA